MFRRCNTDRQLSFSTTNKLRDEEDKAKRLPGRQISSPSAFSTVMRTKETIGEEKEKDEKQSETNEDLRQLSEIRIADTGGVSSSERLLLSSTPIQDISAFGRTVVPGSSREEDKDLENRIRDEGQSRSESKGQKGTAFSCKTNSICMFEFVLVAAVKCYLLCRHILKCGNTTSPFNPSKNKIIAYFQFGGETIMSIHLCLAFFFI